MAIYYNDGLADNGNKNKNKNLQQPPSNKSFHLPTIHMIIVFKQFLFFNKAKVFLFYFLNIFFLTFAFLLTPSSVIYLFSIFH